MSLLFYESTKCCDNLLRYALCAPCVVVGLRATYPDDPWFKDPEDAVELLYHVPRMSASYDPGENEPPALALAWMERHVVEVAGQIFAPCPSFFPQFCCSTWNVIRQASASSTGQLKLLVLPKHVEAVLELMDALTDFKGKPIPVVRESTPISASASSDAPVDAVASQEDRRPAVPTASTEIAAPQAVAVAERV